MHTKTNAVMRNVSRRAFLKGAGAMGLTTFGHRMQGAFVAEAVHKAADRAGKRVNLLPEPGPWGWQFTEGARVVDMAWPKGHSALEVHTGSGDYARFLVLGPTIGKTYTLSGWVRTQGIARQEEAAGAYFSATQFEFQGRPTEFSVDGKQLPEKRWGNFTGDTEWRRFSQTVTCSPSTAWIEMVAGIYRASGTAWFAGLTLVEGDEPADADEVVDLWQAIEWAQEDALKAADRSKPAAAILQDQIPVRGSSSDPRQLGKVLAEAYDISYLSAEQLADATRLNREHFDLLVLPYGESFPLAARSSVLAFLAAGGDLLTTGGYAFQSPVIFKNGQWEFYEDAVRSESGPNLLPVFPAGWKRQGEYAVAEGHTAKVQVPAGLWEQESFWHCDVPAQGEAEQYFFTAQISGEDIRPAPDGYGFISIVQLDERGNEVYVEDLVLEKLRGTRGPDSVERLVVLAPSCRTLRIQCGLQNASGVVRGLDFHLEQRSPQIRINTAWGFPQDELVVDPRQIGMFDADFRLKHAVTLRAAEEQYVVGDQEAIESDMTGYAATCVVGMDKSRWIPLVEARDALGRKRGAAGALVHNVRGEYARGSWAFFGVENRDIFAAGSAPGERILRDLAQALVTKCFLHHCETELASYRHGENVRARVLVSNFGRRFASLKLQWQYVPEEKQQAAFTASQTFELKAGETRTLETAWPAGAFTAEFYSVIATLSFAVDGKVIDEIRTGFPVWTESTLRKGLPFEFQDNYFQVQGRSLFLQGTDDYAHTFVTQDENSLTWKEDARGCRDSCLDVYENLLGLRGPQQRPTKTWWRWIDAMLLNVQRSGGAFFPGMLIFSNTAVGDKDMADQQAYVEAFAARYKDAAGIMYYLNGDLELHDPNLPDLQKLYNEYLRGKYGNDEGLRKAWKLSSPEKPLGELAIRSGSSDWCDLRTLDDFEFRTQLVCRWLNRMHDSVRKADQRHPVTAEFYQTPLAGIDLLTALGNLELANFGYFDLKDDDYYLFPQTCRFLDQSVRGKGINVGEFGVKTHPAWQGCSGYVEARTEQYEQSYFLAIAHYGFALGASKIQNWCWKYPSDLPFEWGINYSNELIGRDVLAFYRNSGLLFRSLRPRYESSDTLFLLAGDNRKGGQGARIIRALKNGIRLLMDQRVPFHTLPDEFIDEIPAGVKTIFYPLPYCPSDTIVKRLIEFVETGGQLYLSGDISYDRLRLRTHTARLKELCGLEFVSERYPNIAYQKGALATKPAAGSVWPSYAATPGIVTKPSGASVLLEGEGGVPIVTEFKRGKGKVVFSSDPIEMHGDPRYQRYAQAFYRALVEQFHLSGEAIEPAGEPVHCFRVPSQDKRDIHVLVNYSDDGKSRSVSMPTSAGKVQLVLDPRMPGVIVAEQGKGILIVECSGDVSADNRLLIASNMHFIAMSLDGQSVSASTAFLLLPMGEGQLRLPGADRWRHPVLSIGESRGGHWKEYKRVKPTVNGNAIEVTIDSAARLAMILVCEEQNRRQVVRRIETLVNNPWNLDRT